MLGINPDYEKLLKSAIPAKLIKKLSSDITEVKVNLLKSAFSEVRSQIPKNDQDDFKLGCLIAEHLKKRAIEKSDLTLTEWLNRLELSQRDRSDKYDSPEEFFSAVYRKIPPYAFKFENMGDLFGQFALGDKDELTEISKTYFDNMLGILPYYNQDDANLETLIFIIERIEENNKFLHEKHEINNLNKQEVEALRKLKEDAAKRHYAYLIQNKSQTYEVMRAYEQKGIEIIKMDPASLTDGDYEFLEDFLLYCIGNKPFNAKLRQMSKVGLQIQDQVLNTLAKFGFKSSLVNKVDYEKLRQGGLAGLTLLETRNAINISETMAILEKYNTDRMPKLKELKEKSTTCLQHVRDLKNNKTKYRKGDILVERTDLLIVINNVKEFFEKLEIWLNLFFIKVGHTGLVQFDAEGNAKHSWKGDTTVTPLETKDEFRYEVYRINFLALMKNLSDEQKGALYDALGVERGNEEKLKTKLHEKFEEASQELQKEILDNSEVSVEWARKKSLISLLADYIPYGHRRSKGDIRQWAQNRLEGDGPRIIDPGSSKIVCSEFVAKLTVLALVKVENEANSHIDNEEHKVQFDMPFHRNENLSRMHPGRLIKELLKRNAVEKVDQHNTVTTIVSNERSR